MMFKHAMVAGLVSVALTACGGGGSSSGSTADTGTDTNTSTDSSVVHTSSLVAGDGGGATSSYDAAAGNVTLAQLTTNNQQAFVSLLYGSVDNAESIGAIGKSTTTNVAKLDSASLIVRVSNDAEKFSTALAAKSVAEREISETYACGSSGSVHITGTLDNSTSRGTLYLDYDNCVETSGGAVFTGKATFTINQIGSQHWTDYVVGYDDFSIFTISENWIVKGSQQVNKVITNAAVSSYTVVSDIYSANQTTGRSTLDQTTDQFQVVAATGAVSSTVISGVLCDYIYGCVTTATRIPFAYNTGELTMSGASNSKLKVYVDSGYLMSQLDEGNGAYQNPVKFTY